MGKKIRNAVILSAVMIAPIGFCAPSEPANYASLQRQAAPRAYATAAEASASVPSYSSQSEAEKAGMLFDGRAASKVADDGGAIAALGGSRLSEMFRLLRESGSRQPGYLKSVNKVEKETSLKSRICIGEEIEEDDFKLSLVSTNYALVEGSDPAPIIYVTADFNVTENGAPFSVEANQINQAKFKLKGRDAELYVVEAKKGKAPPKCIGIELKIK